MAEDLTLNSVTRFLQNEHFFALSLPPLLFRCRNEIALHSKK